MKMKKILLFLILALSVFLCSCGNTQTSSEETTQSVTETSETETTAPEPVNSTATAVSTALVKDNFVKDGQFINYAENGQIKTVQGIDVSEFNEEIDFQDVKDAGIDFVMVRLGGRGYGDAGTLYGDAKALEHIANAKKAGLKVGGYFFSQAVTPEEAEQEAEYAVNALNGETLDMPIAFDWEEIQEDTARTDNLDNNILTECAKAFCDSISDMGYSSMIYAKAEVFARYNTEILSDYDFWFAEYRDVPSVLKGYTMWQYSESAVIDGIGTTDLNMYFIN